MNEFPSLADAMTYIANELINSGRSVPGVREHTSIGSNFGAACRPTKEILGFTFTILDPRSSIIDRPSRPINVAFALSSLLWAVSGSNRVEDIAFWNSRASNFSDDGRTLRSALGSQLFLEQFRRATDRLRIDPTTRRAYISLISSQDLTTPTRDVPCTIGLQLMIRDSQLMAVAMMRSQSALLVLPYDISLLTAIQCMAASEIGVHPGPYMHISSSIHFYDEELDLAREVAEGNVYSVSLPEVPGLQDIKDLALWESQLHQASPYDLLNLAKDLVAEPKAYSYRTVVQATLLLHLLERVGLSERTEDLLRLAGKVGNLALRFISGSVS